MKFGELMDVFNGMRIRIIQLNRAGGVTMEEISLLDTVDAYMKLAAYRDKAVVRFTAGETTDAEGERYTALEVVVNE